jgi:hypothetical protein
MMVIYLCDSHTLADALRDMNIHNAVEVPTRAQHRNMPCDAACPNRSTHTARITFVTTEA